MRGVKFIAGKVDGIAGIAGEIVRMRIAAGKEAFERAVDAYSQRIQRSHLRRRNRVRPAASRCVRHAAGTITVQRHGPRGEIRERVPAPFIVKEEEELVSLNRSAE